MTHLSLGDLTPLQVEALVAVTYEPEQPALWDALSQGDLTPAQKGFLDGVLARLEHYQAHRANEATTWARAIYPLLVLAERDSIRAFSEVAVGATIGETELGGIVDGALAVSVQEDPRAPLVVVVEAKRGVGGKDPLAQLLGALLCVAAMNHRAGHEAPSYGCYTIADSWTFARATCRLDGEGRATQMSVTFSREYTERTEALAIVRVLQSLVAQTIGEAPGGS